MIKLLGSKRKLTPWLTECLAKHVKLEGIRVLDAFAGTGHVALALAKKGAIVTANDRADYAIPLLSSIFSKDLQHSYSLIPAFAGFASCSVPDSWFVNNYASNGAMFFTAENAASIAGIREAILNDLFFTERQRNVLLGCLIHAADKVCNSQGLQMAYFKKFSPVSLKPLVFKPVWEWTGEDVTVTQADAVEAAKSAEFDLVYADPPYTTSSYSALYHIHRTIAKWDNPEVYGVARKRVDTYEKPSPWNSRKEVAGAFEALKAATSGTLAVSYSSDSLLSKEQLAEILKPVAIYETEHRRYNGATTGKYHGAKPFDPTTVKPSNTEYLFIC